MSDRGPFDPEAIVRALREGGVEFIVIGGLAVIAHGYERYTNDIDVVPAPDRDNLARLASVLKDLDYRIFGTDEFEGDELVHPDVEALLAGGNWRTDPRTRRSDQLGDRLEGGVEVGSREAADAR